MSKNSKFNGAINGIDLSQFINWDLMKVSVETYMANGIDEKAARLAIMADLASALKVGVEPDMVLTATLEEIQAAVGMKTNSEQDAEDEQAFAAAMAAMDQSAEGDDDWGDINPFANAAPADAPAPAHKKGGIVISTGFNSRDQKVDPRFDGAYKVHVKAVVNPGKFGIGHGAVSHLYGAKGKEIFSGSGIFHSEKAYICQDENLVTEKVDRKTNQPIPDSKYYPPMKTPEGIVLYESRSFVLPAAAFITKDQLGQKSGFFKSGEHEVVYMQADGQAAKSWTEGPAYDHLVKLFIDGFKSDMETLQSRVGKYSIVELAKEAKKLDPSQYKAFCLKTWEEYGLDEASTNFGWVAFKRIRDTKGNTIGDHADVKSFWEFRDAINKVADAAYQLKNPHLDEKKKDTLEKDKAMASQVVTASRKKFLGQLPTDDDYQAFQVAVLMDRYGYTNPNAFANKAKSLGFNVQ